MSNPGTGVGGVVYQGWWVLLASVVGCAVGLPASAVLTFGVFIRPLGREFGWNRGQISFAFTVMVMAIALGSLAAGYLLDRWGPRRLILSSTLALGLSLITLRFLSSSLVRLYAAYASVAIAGLGTTALTYSRLVSNWFDRRRGLALGITNGGVALGAFTMPLLAQHWINSGGWRSAYVFLGFTVWVVGLPLILLFLRDAPDGTALKHGDESVRNGSLELTVKQALKTRVFWQLLAIFSIAALCFYACIGHLSPLLTDRGVSITRAAFAISLFGVAGIVGRLCCGYLLDHFPAPWVMVGFFGGATFGVALLWMQVSGSWIFLAPILIGMGFGAESDIMPFLITRYFGLASSSALFGFMYCSFSLATGVGMYVMGAGFDVTHSYRPVLKIFTAMMLFAIGVAMLLPSNKGLTPGARKRLGAIFSK